MYISTRALPGISRAYYHNTVVNLILNSVLCSVREHCYSIRCIYPLPGGRVGPVGGIEGLEGLHIW